MDVDGERFSPTHTSTQLYIPQKLTEEQRRRGQARYAAFSIGNGISFACLADSIVILYALKIGVTPWVVAATSSFIFLTLPFMLLGRRLTRRNGAARTIFHAWVSRNIFILGLLFVPWLAATVSIEAATLLLVTSVFGFWSSRSVGMVAMFPIIGAITTTEDSGRFNSRIFACFHCAFLLTTLLIIGLFHATGAPIWTFQAMICVGCVIGITGGFFASQIPETDVSTRSASYPLRLHAAMLVRSQNLRHIMVAWVACASAGALIAPFSMLALKKGYHIPDSEAMLYAVTMAFGSLLGSLAIGRISGKTDPKPLIIMFFCGFFFPVIMWMAAPVAFASWYCLLIFGVIGVCATGAEISLTHYFLNAAPANHRLGLTLVLHSTVGFLAGLAGSVLGAGILKALSGAADPLLLYKHYFIVILVLLALGFLAIAKLERLNITHTGKYIGIFLSTLTFGFFLPRRPEEPAPPDDD